MKNNHYNNHHRNNQHLKGYLHRPQLLTTNLEEENQPPNLAPKAQ
jgi:hypothetical protein